MVKRGGWGSIRSDSSGIDMWHRYEPVGTDLYLCEAVPVEFVVDAMIKSLMARLLLGRVTVCGSCSHQESHSNLAPHSVLHCVPVGVS